MKCGGYYKLCQEKAKPIIIFGEGKDKFGFCIKCAKKYSKTCCEHEKRAIQQAIVTYEAVKQFANLEKGGKKSG